MKLTFVSNYINHHQTPVSDRLYELLGADYAFIETEKIAVERVNMGWGKDASSIPYVKRFYEEPATCRKLIMNSDIVVFGGCEDEGYIEPRLKAGKPVIRYSERLYREGQWKAVSPRGLKKKYHDHTRYRDSEVYLLCAGAYVASDFFIVRSYPGKMFKWGYFTERINYNIDELMAGKGRGRVNILFAGRFIALKHPEYGLKLAERLQKKNISFHLDYVGGGALEEKLKAAAAAQGLEPYVSFHGYKTPEEVRGFMEKADIFLMTSNYLEGWGAVINEAMNSGCCVIADSKIGAVPFLIRHGHNGIVYKDGHLREFLKLATELATDSERRGQIGRNAYQTIEDTWNPDNAARALYEFAQGLMKGELVIKSSGPLSRAPVIWPWQGYSHTRSTQPDKYF